MPTSCDRTCFSRTKRSLLVCACSLCVTVGCQSTRMAKLPGLGWLASDDQPPVLDSSEAASSYPAPSAAATPTALSEANAAAPSSADTPTGYPSTQYPSLSQTAAAQGNAPAAAAIPRRAATPPSAGSFVPAPAARARDAGKHTPSGRLVCESSRRTWPPLRRRGRPQPSCRLGCRPGSPRPMCQAVAVHHRSRNTRLTCSGAPIR